MLDPVEFGKAMAVIVREAQAPLLMRIEQLEARQTERGEKGDPGKDAVVDESNLKFLVDTAVLSALLAAPPPKGDKGDSGEKGDPGKDGKDADPIDVKEVVAELLTAPEIKLMVDLHVAEAVVKHFEAHPVQNGKDGANGRDGKDGERGGIGPIGEKGDPGADGVGLAGAMIDRDGSLIITTTKGAPINLGRVVGKDGERGKDGADLSTVALEYDGHRTVSVKAGNNGEVVKTYKLGIPMDAGYWREGREAEKGDVMTHDGNAWIALRDTKAKPCRENKEDWRLFARKGRDGTDGTNGRNIGPAPPVKLS